MARRDTQKCRLGKLAAPRVPRALVRRRLHARLDDLAGRGVVWIAAAPGSGKSTLAATWAAVRGHPLLWYRVDEGDADAASAFAYFARLSGSARRRHELPAWRPGPGVDVAAFARMFFRAFFARVPAASTLVIDDAHNAAGDFDALVTAAIREVPDDVAMLVVGRSDPAGAVLGELARGRVNVLDARELSFTEEEAVELLADRMDPERARRACARTDGWPTGLRLFAETPADALDAMPSALRSLEAYFSAGVLATLDDAEQRVLAVASLLPDVDAATLDRLGPGRNAVALLERLRERHAFVTALDRHPASWRIHDLLRDALRSHFDALGDAEWRARTLGLAAEAAVRRGLSRDATRLYVEAGNAEAALRFAEAEARGLVKAHRGAELEAMLGVLDAACVERSAALQFALGELAWTRNDPRTAVTVLERAYALAPSASPSPTALIVAATVLGAILDGWQDFDGVAAWLHRVAGHFPARDAVADGNDALRIDSVCLRAMDMAWDGVPFAKHDALVSRVLEHLRRRDAQTIPDEALAASAVLIETATYRSSDEQLFHAVVAASAAWLDDARTSPIAKAGWLVTFGPAARRWPVTGVKLPAATGVACIELALELARRYGAPSIAYSAAYFLVNIAVSENDRVAARTAIKALREATAGERATQAVNLLLAEAGLAALEEEWTRAAAAVDRADALARGAGFPASERWSIEMTRQRVRIATGSGAAAREALLALALGCPEGTRRRLAAILADVADAAATLQAGAALPGERVRSILSAARAEAWPGFANLLAPVASRICSDALRMGIEPEFARQVIVERRLEASDPDEPHWPWPVRIFALGTLRVEIDGEPLDFGTRMPRKPLELLKVIVANGPAPVDSALVLDALWPEAEGGVARASFDMAVMRLRRLLRRDDALRLEGGRIMLHRGCAWVDAWSFLSGASDDYPGPLFGTDSTQAWCASARERLHQRFLQRVQVRASRCERTGDLDAAVAAYEAGLRQDPLAEELYRGLIRCHRAAGRQAEAVRALRRCREQLSIVLGVAPSPATIALLHHVAPSR